jgi:hypothetical protein
MRQENVMGVIFKKKVRTQPLADAISDKVSEHLPAMRANDGSASQTFAREVTQLAAQPETSLSVNWRPFFVALGLFFVLLAAVIVLELRDAVDDLTFYYGMVTTVLGGAMGFLTGEATGSTVTE